MEQAIFIVVYRHSVALPWQEKVKGVFTDRKLAENYVEILKAQGFAEFIGFVEGLVVCPASEAEAEKQLGPFK
jgi:hypothetical protein